MEPAAFLNLDLALEGPESLDPLAEYFSDCAFVLYNGETPDGFLLAAEPLLDGELSQELQACTNHFLGVLDQMPEDLVALFRRCRLRVFDYGFDGGSEAPPLTVALTPEQLARMASWDVEMRVTLYPYREDLRELEGDDVES